MTEEQVKTKMLTDILPLWIKIRNNKTKKILWRDIQIYGCCHTITKTNGLIKRIHPKMVYKIGENHDTRTT